MMFSKKVFIFSVSSLFLYLLRREVVYFLQVPWWVIVLSIILFEFSDKEIPFFLSKFRSKEGENCLEEPFHIKGKLHVGRSYNLKKCSGEKITEISFLRRKVLSDGTEKFVDNHNRNQHLLVSGVTGSGKTSALFYFISQDLRESDTCLLIVDPKGDVKFLKSVKNEAQKLGRKVFVFSPFLPVKFPTSKWNPVHSTENAIELAERVFSSLQFDVEARFYAEKSLEVLRDFSELFFALKLPKRLDLIFAAIFNINGYLDDILKRFSYIKEPDPTLSIAIDEIVRMRKKRYYEEVLQNMKAQLSYASTVKEIQSYINVENPDLDIERAISEKAVVIFSFPGPVLPRISNSLGRLFVAELKQLIGKFILKGKEVDISLYLDEFPVLLFNGIEDLFSMGRAGGIKITVALQNFSQMEAIIGEASTRAILGNINMKLIMKQNETRSAREVSELIGEGIFVTQSEQLNRDEDSVIDGARRFSISEERHSLVPVNIFLELKKGEAIGILDDGVYFLTLPYLIKRRIDEGD